MMKKQVTNIINSSSAPFAKRNGTKPPQDSHDMKLQNIVTIILFQSDPILYPTLPYASGKKC